MTFSFSHDGIDYVSVGSFLVQLYILSLPGKKPTLKFEMLKFHDDFLKKTDEECACI